MYCRGWRCVVGVGIVVWWRLDSGIFHLWVVGCTCISMDMSITICVMQTLVPMALLSKSWPVPKEFHGTSQWPVVSNGEACLCVLEVLLQDQAMLVCPLETTVVQPCGPVVCRRIPKWRVGHSTPPFEGVYIDAVSLPVFLYSRINHTVFLYSQIDHTLAYTLQEINSPSRPCSLPSSSPSLRSSRLRTHWLSLPPRETLASLKAR
jgi:hypothetical protein